MLFYFYVRSDLSLLTTFYSVHSFNFATFISDNKQSFEEKA